MNRNKAWALCVALAGSGLLAGCGGNDHSPPLEVKVLSSRPDMVSGGTAFVEVASPAGITATDITMQLNGIDVSSAFAKRADGRVTGLVTGLTVGDNKLVAKAANTGSAALTITNFPIGGPIISGPQIQPWICAAPTASAETATSPAINASGLSTVATDSQCNIKTETKLWYKSTVAGCTNVLPDPVPMTTAAANSCFKKYDPAAAAPADLATTTNDAGVKVPYIVRVERGTLNRGIYDIAVLFDPTTAWLPTAPQAGWNGKVFYTFGSSTGQPRRQFRSAQSWTTEEEAIKRGFLVAMNSLTDSALNSNRVMMSETVMMMKEHIIKGYGPIKFTMSNGCSGGSINQLTNGSISPGLIDGILPTCTYPDSQTTGLEVADCQLLVTAYNSPQWIAVTGGLAPEIVDAKKAAINGHMDQTGCHAWYNLFSSSDIPGNYFKKSVDQQGVVTAATASTNNCGLLAKDVYDPVTNPNGIRCGSQDAAVAIWGKVAGTNRARDTRDNVGIQYGLKAFKSNAITAEEFVTLNEAIGGTDSDLKNTAARSVGDPEALAIAYKAGIVSSGKQLAKTAIIDVRGFDDSILAVNVPPNNRVGATIFGIHHIWRSFSLRDRLDQANGGHGNLVLWRFGTGLAAPAASGLTLAAFLEMDKWVTAIKADTSTTRTLEQKVVAAKPATSVDFCYLSTDTGFTTKVTDPAVCNGDKYLVSHSSPRQVAGGSVSENILKCQLKPLNVADYAPATLNALQLARMNAVFAGGVCDWSKSGVGQQDAVSPLTFAAGSGGAPIPAVPTSSAL
jgi:hypothetical protein